MRILRRSAVVAICYLLSHYGIIASLTFFAMSGTKSLCGTLVGISILGAWVAHITMSFNWIINRRVQKYIPVWGTVAGSVSLVLWPLTSSSQSTMGIELGSRMLAVIGMGLLFTLPCLLLAIWLVRFHMTQEPSDAAANS